MQSGLWLPNLCALLLHSLLTFFFSFFFSFLKSLKVKVQFGAGSLGLTAGTPPRVGRRSSRRTPGGRGRRRASGGPMAVAAPHLAVQVGPRCAGGSAPRPAQVPPRRDSAGGNSCAGGTRREWIPAGGLGHGTSVDLDPREGGSLAERWAWAESGLRGAARGEGKEKRTSQVCRLVNKSCIDGLPGTRYCARQKDRRHDPGGPENSEWVSRLPNNAGGGQGGGGDVRKTERRPQRAPAHSISFIFPRPQSSVGCS